MPTLRDMRITTHVVGLLSLFFALMYAWNHQFERMPGGHVVGINDLQMIQPHAAHIRRDSQALILSARGDTRHATFDLPLGATASHLFIRVSAQAKQLMQGEEIWQDGRTFIEWLSPENQRVTVSPIHSAQGSSGSSASFAIETPPGNLRPVLRMENLGKQGDYLLNAIELTPARHTRLWKWIGPLMMGVFVFLLTSLLRIKQSPSFPRRLLASCITATVAYFFIIPGPWPQIKGLGQELAWDAPWEPALIVPSPQILPLVASGAVGDSDHPTVKNLPSGERYSKLPEPDNLALRAKKALAKIRSLLHFTLLFCPVWVVCYGVGSQRGLLLGVGMALGIETAQWLFGYGFQADDVKDLVADACGISLAVLCHTLLSRKIHSWMPFPFPQPA